jgi:hypothetical protein
MKISNIPELPTALGTAKPPKIRLSLSYAPTPPPFLPQPKENKEVMSITSLFG